MAKFGFSPSGKSLFTPEEDQKVIYLKEQKDFSWREIAKYFRGRTQGTLQVRYSRKLCKQHQYHSLAEEFIEDIEKQIAKRIQGTKKRTDAPVEEHSEQETGNPVDEQQTELGTEHTEKQQGQLIEQLPVPKMSLRPVRSTPRRQAMPLQEGTNQEVPEHVGAKTRTAAKTQRPIAIKPGWNPIPALERSPADFKYPETIPDVFVNPPTTHIIEFNNRSGSYRIRRRRENDSREEGKAVSFAEEHESAVADAEGNSYQPAKRRKTATSRAPYAAHIIEDPAPSPPVTQTSLVQPIERPGRSSIAFGPTIQDSDDDDEDSDDDDEDDGDDDDSSLTTLEDNPADEGNTSASASEEGSGSSEGSEGGRRASEETESSTVSGFCE